MPQTRKPPLPMCPQYQPLAISPARAFSPVLHQRGHVVGLIAHALAIIGPVGRQHVIADTPAVEMQFVQPQRGDVNRGAPHRLVNRKGLSQIAQGGRVPVQRQGLVLAGSHMKRLPADLVIHTELFHVIRRRIAAQRLVAYLQRRGAFLSRLGQLLRHIARSGAIGRFVDRVQNLDRPLGRRRGSRFFRPHPLGLPIGGIQQPFRPKRRLAPGRRLAVAIPHPHLPIGRLSRRQRLSRVHHVGALVGCDLPAYPTDRLRPGRVSQAMTTPISGRPSASDRAASIPGSSPAAACSRADPAGSSNTRTAIR